jgi:hypothetical protein
MRDDEIGLTPTQSIYSQLVRLVESKARNFGEERLRRAVFLDVAKAYDTVWIDESFCKLKLLNFRFT